MYTLSSLLAPLKKTAYFRLQNKNTCKMCVNHTEPTTFHIKEYAPLQNVTY